MIMTHCRAHSLVPLCISFAFFAFVLTPALFEISSSLSLRSMPTPLQSSLGYVTHLIALACIVIVPCMLAVIGNRHWLWTAFYAVASAMIFLLAARLARDTNHFFADGIRLSGTFFFFITFALMIGAATLGVVIRASYMNRKWVDFCLGVLGYLVAALVAFVFLAIPLFVE